MWDWREGTAPGGTAERSANGTVRRQNVPPTVPNGRDDYGALPCSACNLAHFRLVRYGSAQR